MENNEQEVINAFQMMWGNYPEPVRLIHRSFRIVAGNSTWLNNGGIVGAKCNATNPEAHKNCRAMEALREHKATSNTSNMAGVQWVSYWIPLDGCDDYYIHFTNGMNEYITNMKASKAQDC